MSDFHLIWRDQCGAAEGIREQFGSHKALGYLIGEKLVNFAHAAMTDRDFAMELPKFATEVRAMFRDRRAARLPRQRQPNRGARAHLLRR